MKLHENLEQDREILREIHDGLTSGDPGTAGNTAPVIPVKTIFKQAFNLKADTASYGVINERLTSAGQVTGTNLSILFFAIIIASVGLNMNSPAVIIGAMLVSPLMGTILLMALGVSTADSQKFKKAAFGFGFQVIVAILTSTLYFLLSPVNTATSELLARTNPTVYDVLIATAGGFAGIIGNTRKDTSNNVIPGVAIATALMPPLCTCGFSIANQHWAMLGGALYLFIINSFFIFLSATIVLFILEVPKVGHYTEERAKRLKRILIRNAVIILLPSIFLGINLARTSRAENANAQQITSEVVSTVSVTEQMKVLFPEVDSVQVGQLERTNDEGKLTRENIMILGTSKDLTKKQKARLEAWVETMYDEDYHIIYGSSDTLKKAEEALAEEAEK